jgi:hypothetical protein
VELAGRPGAARSGSATRAPFGSSGAHPVPGFDGAVGRARAEEEGHRIAQLDLTPAQLKLVTSCSDLSQLATWFDQALDAKTTDEIFDAH